MDAKFKVGNIVRYTEKFLRFTGKQRGQAGVPINGRVTGVMDGKKGTVSFRFRGRPFILWSNAGYEGTPKLVHPINLELDPDSSNQEKS